MQLKIELFDIFLERRSRCWFSLLEINYNESFESLLYIEWGQSWKKIQISFLFGLLKNY